MDFYALGDDLRNIVQFLYAETDIVIFELSSNPGCEPRSFRSLAELEAAFKLGSYRAGNLQLWSPSVMKQPVFERADFNADTAARLGHSFRYSVRGAGLIQLYLNGLQDGVIYHTHYGHWNEAGACKRSMYPADDCDWKALTKLSGRIQRHIRGKLSAAKLYSRPVLQHAYNALQQKNGLWWGPDVKYADSADIKSIR
ncbi:MAG TPA: hypothetical protein VG733_17635 [Chthoniobacteraceae bacterium]|nr:hypothetical protein [Chthoniobacteraceae bacterium]